MATENYIKQELEGLRKIDQNITNNKSEIGKIKPDLRNVIDRYGDFSVIQLYLTYFNQMPQIITQEGIDNEKVYRFLIEQYANDLQHHIFDTRINEDNTITYNHHICFLYEDLIIHFDYLGRIRYLFLQTDIRKVEKIINQLAAFREEEEKDGPEINILVQGNGGIKLQSLPLTAPKLDIASNYNEDFLPVHEVIYKRLNQDNDKGLVLLHGKPGTGKTSYVRFLAASLQKDIIFLPPDMASAITHPDLISLLMKNRNSILVIEDAEKIIIDRDNNGYSPVSTLLNLADGLLSDCLNIQIICTFNTDLSKVDKALLRKGRLIAKYEFKELEAAKARALSDKLGYHTKIVQPMLLTAIYHQEEQEFKQKNEKNPLGFNFGKTA